MPRHGRHAWHLYVVRVGPEYGCSRDELVELLGNRSIGTSVHFIPLHTMPYFRLAALVPPHGLPIADAVFEQLLSLPMHPALTDADIDGVTDAISELQAQGQGARRPT